LDSLGRRNVRRVRRVNLKRTALGQAWTSSKNTSLGGKSPIEKKTNLFEGEREIL